MGGIDIWSYLVLVLEICSSAASWKYVMVELSCFEEYHYEIPTSLVGRSIARENVELWCSTKPSVRTWTEPSVRVASCPLTRRASMEANLHEEWGGWAASTTGDLHDE